MFLVGHAGGPDEYSSPARGSVFIKPCWTDTTTLLGRLPGTICQLYFKASTLAGFLLNIPGKVAGAALGSL